MFNNSPHILSFTVTNKHLKPYISFLYKNSFLRVKNAKQEKIGGYAINNI